MALASSLGCASTARASVGSRSRIETRSSISAHSSSRRTLLLGSCILANSSSNSMQVPTQSQPRMSIVQAASVMPNTLIDAHVHVWASVDDARSGKYPYYVSLMFAWVYADITSTRQPWGYKPCQTMLSSTETQHPVKFIT